MLGTRRRNWTMENLGDSTPPDEPPDHIAVLLKLADALKAPDDVRKQIVELDRSAAASKQAAEVARTEQRKVEEAHAGLEREKQEQSDRIAGELKQHQAKMSLAEAELASVKKAAADLKRAAEADRADAAAIKARMQQKMKLIEAA